ncbi:MAG: hypothetical protein ABSD03_04875 [Vulcanimicrobiaceae bacterium]|jgi:hypothetical protein
MMMDDDALDRALAALPLDEPPADLQQRILARTVYAPRAALRGWELWVIAIAAALVGWFGWVLLSAPHAQERITDTLARVIAVSGLDSMNTVLWLAAGVSATWWIVQLSVPDRRRRIEVR